MCAGYIIGAQQNPRRSTDCRIDARSNVYRGFYPRGALATDDGSCGSADARGVNQGDFSCYVRGLCTLCREGTFDQVLSLMLRVYSTAREEQLIGRAELAAILESHIVYDDFEVGFFVVSQRTADSPSIAVSFIRLHV